MAVAFVAVGGLDWGGGWRGAEGGGGELSSPRGELSSPPGELSSPRGKLSRSGNHGKG